MRKPMGEVERPRCGFAEAVEVENEGKKGNVRKRKFEYLGKIHLEGFFHCANPDSLSGEPSHQIFEAIVNFNNRHPKGEIVTLRRCLGASNLKIDAE